MGSREKWRKSNRKLVAISIVRLPAYFVFVHFLGDDDDAKRRKVYLKRAQSICFSLSKQKHQSKPQRYSFHLFVFFSLDFRSARAGAKCYFSFFADSMFPGILWLSNQQSVMCLFHIGMQKYATISTNLSTLNFSLVFILFDIPLSSASTYFIWFSFCENGSDKRDISSIDKMAVHKYWHSPGIGAHIHLKIYYAEVCKQWSAILILLLLSFYPFFLLPIDYNTALHADCIFYFRQC